MHESIAIINKWVRLEEMMDKKNKIQLEHEEKKAHWMRAEEKRKCCLRMKEMINVARRVKNE